MPLLSNDDGGETVMDREYTSNILTRDALTGDDRWQQLMMHEGTAYIVRAEQGGTYTLWRSVPPQTFSYVTSAATQDALMRAMDGDFNCWQKNPSTAAPDGGEVA